MDLLKNFAYSTVATAPSPGTSGTSLVTATGEGARFATPPFNAVIWPAGAIPLPSNAEIARVSGISSDTLTIARAQEGSSARSVIVGDQIMGGVTLKTLTDIQAALAASLQPGCIASGDAALTINSTSQVTIAAATQLWVANAAGLILPVATSSTVLSGITAAATFTRLDQIVVDSTGTVSRLAGSESNGVTLANRTGAAAIPSGSRLLHDILVTTGGVLAANVRDRRQWARGAYNLISRTAAGAGGGYTSPSSTAAIDSTNLSVRMECSGVPVRVKLQGTMDAPIGSTHIFQLAVDGSTPTGLAQYFSVPGSAAGAYFPVTIVFEYTPSAGSHLFVPFWNYTGANSGLLLANATNGLVMTVEEIVRQNATNGVS